MPTPPRPLPTEVAARTVTRQTAVDQVEDLDLEKTTTADGFDGTSESIPYSYKVTNAGTVTLSGTLEIERRQDSVRQHHMPGGPREAGLRPARS